MVEREGEELALVCDDCGDWLDRRFYNSQFRDMIEFAKTQGWTVSKNSTGDWVHQCPGCKPTGVAAQRRLLGL